MNENTSFRDEILAALQERVTELEECHRQILALRLEASVRTAYLIDLQNQLESALERARRSEAEANETRANVALAAMQALDALATERTSVRDAVIRAAMRVAELRGGPLPERE